MSNVKNSRLGNNFIIGLFVIIGLGLIFSSIIWLGTTQLFKDQSIYVTYFEGSVEGLETGSAVKYLGVPVGSVTKISVAKDGRLVEVLMRIDSKIELNDSLRVKSEISGIAGSKFLQLYFPNNFISLNSYPKLRFEPEFTLIKSAPSEIQEITIALREVIDNLKMLNVGDISEGTLQFLEASKQMMTATSEVLDSKDFKGILYDVKNSTESLSKLLYALDENELVNNISDAGAKVLIASNKIDKFVDDLTMTLDSLKINYYIEMTYGKLDSTFSNIDKSVSSTFDNSSHVLINLNETLNEVRKSNKELQSTMKYLRDNPSLFLTNPPKR